MRTDMRAMVLGCVLGIALFTPASNAISQGDPAMTTGCFVDGTNWRPGTTFRVQARTKVEGDWYYKDQEITHSYKTIAKQSVPAGNEVPFEYEFVSEQDGETLTMLCVVDIIGSDNGKRMKFKEAFCKGDRPYECEKNYDGTFRIRFTIE